MDKNALLMIIAGLILLAAGIYGAWFFIDELIFVVKGLIGIIIALAGFFILVVGIFTLKD
ncbi:MAG: hypothetical protein JW931_09880 [Methanomicrobiaceae archaeon]|nr:hypothetical protein [Methanomicrobiaceae archaeon]